MSLYGSTIAEKIWNWLANRGFNHYACAGIIANFDCESGLNPKNIQDSFQARLGFTDDSYVAAVDSGTYSREQFATDGAGAFLCQWTWHTRKRALYDFCKSRGTSIGDLESQLEFFLKELSVNYTSVLTALRGATSVHDAVVVMMLKYEQPFDQSLVAQNKRVSVGQKYYNRFVTVKTEGVINVGYKYYTKGQAVKISEHFYSTEFDCHGKGCCSQTIVNDKLPIHLEQIRNHFNAPVTITSPYRCPIHNSRPSVGGAPGSRHTKGDACDIVVKGFSPRVVAQYCESIGILGIGLYETKDDGYFVHIDERDYKSFWYGQASRPVTTFGTQSGSINVSPNTQNTNNLDTILNIGDQGDSVKALQEKLIRLGYSCGDAGADGDFGNDTYQAVLKFQSAYSLGMDGIAGNQTLAAIDDAIRMLDSVTTSDTLVGQKVKTTASLLNVRSGAGMENRIVKQVKAGTIATVLAEQGGWCQLDNPSGWVSKDYITEV